ncbi:MAG: hypothetical protein GW886_08820 [Rhodobacterales bacterium]|nr:hypothetical protein [Rhodobacterales bacterium]NCT12421.1 hypothetical protein [Rhodobacterales bacterium]
MQAKPSFHGTDPGLVMTEVVTGPDLAVLRGVPAAGAVAGPLAVVFCSAGRQVRAAAAPEFAGSLRAAGRRALFVFDPAMTWYADPAVVARIVATIRDEMQAVGAMQVDTIGFSMGAYGAMAFGAHLPVRFALAIAPRFTPDPAILRDARAVPHLAGLSGRFAMPTLAEGMARVQAGAIIHGTLGPDRPHLPLFPRLAAVDHWLMPGVGHEVPHQLKRLDLLRPVLHAALGADRAALARLLRPHATRPRSALGLRLLLTREAIALRLRERREARAPHPPFKAPEEGHAHDQI